jgi:hypothetical protein
MKIPDFVNSKNAKIIILAFFVIVAFARNKPNIISWDVLAHYLYLPATFIYDDPGIRNHTALFEKIEQYELSATFYQVVMHENGNNIIKTTTGWAILHSPFFFGAHVVALLGPAPADGFSMPYQFAMMLSSVLFICIGLIYIRKILRYLFNDHTALITMIVLVFGTNLFHTWIYITSVHLMLFGLYAFFTWQVIRWHEDPVRGKAFLIGLSAGFITLLRPTDAICLLVPLLWGVYNLSTFRKKWILISTHWNHMLLVVLGGLLTILPQILYWKLFTGSWIYYSYNTPGEGMDFFTPYIKEVLFSYRKGWFVYTPLMLLAIGGFITLFRYHRKAFYPLLIFTILNTYLISCWTCWWYAGSFGHRAFIHSYALMAIPLGSLIFDLISKKRLFTYIMFFVIFMIMMLNLFQSWQFRKRIIDPSRMTKEYYWAVFGKLSEVDDKTKELLMLERSIVAEDYTLNRDKYFLKTTLHVDYTDMPEIPAERIQTDSSGLSYVVLDSNYVFTPGYKRAYQYLSKAEHLYFIIKTEVYFLTDPAENLLSMVVHFSHKGGAYKYRAVDSEKMNPPPLKDQWTKIEYLYLSPEIRHPADEFTTYFWLRGTKPVYVKNIEIEVWEPIRGW